MALTKSELQLLHSIDTKVEILTDRQQKQFESTDRLKIDVKELKRTVYENGLNSRVKELHEWMQEQRAAVKVQEREKVELAKQDDQQEHEIKLLGFKMTQERKSQIIIGCITGGFSLFGIIISTLLSK
jgi:hypothetical protein